MCELLLNFGFYYDQHNFGFDFEICVNLISICVVTFCEVFSCQLRNKCYVLTNAHEYLGFLSVFPCSARRLPVCGPS